MANVQTAENNNPYEESDVVAAPSEPLTSAQCARMERNRLRACALKEAKLLVKPQLVKETCKGSVQGRDTGGGFLLEEESAEREARGARKAQAQAPIVHEAEQPECVECGRRFPQSYLFDTFGHRACDECRDEDGEHALVTRTTAKSEFLLQDCDLDSRPPPLRCERRRNPHAHARARGDMRLYLRAQVRERALQVWGSERALQEERERRAARRAAGAARGAARRLRALRMDVRSSLYDRSHRTHRHQYEDTGHDPHTDTYTSTCTLCGHTYTYEKM